MTTVVKKPLYESKNEGTDVPFIKLGLFDENNYKPSELKKAKETENTYKPVRLVAGDVVTAAIAGITQSKFGDVLDLVDVTITRADKKNKGERDHESEMKLGVSVDLKNKLSFKKKSVGDIVTIEYLGKYPSPKDASRTLHKVNVE
jgi:hypothetical protein